MASLSKFLSKLIRDRSHAIVLSASEDTLEHVTDSFRSVFIIGDFENRIKHRSIIYREDFKSVGELPDIKIIIGVENDLVHIDELGPVFAKSHPLFFVFTQEYISKRHAEKFKSIHYELIEKRKQFEIWQFKGKRKL
jgi:hypothetical protein